MDIRHKLILVVAACLLLITGCSGDVDTDGMFADANSTNVQRAATLYTVYQAKHNWTGPESREALVEWAKTLPANQLERIGVDPNAIAEMLDQGTDGQPLKFRWGIVTKPRDPPVPIVFESSAIEGKFKVAFTGYVFKEVEQAEYDRLWSGEGDEQAAPQGRPGS
ncbi:MAG: hypothetical protein AAF456_06200 [Planctomycetota bacterium]